MSMEHTKERECVIMKKKHKEKEIKFKTLYDKNWKEVEKLCESNDPLIVAGVILAQALKLYKTALSDDDFERMMQTILDSRTEIRPLSGPTLH